MKIKRGLITVVQEGRFRLVGDDGVSMHFVLAHDAAIEPQDLGRLQLSGMPVAVHYQPSSRIVAAVAHDIEVPSRMPELGGKSR